MNYTQEEREVAQALVNNKPALELLAKVFLETEDKLTQDIITSKTNDQLGELVRADDMAEQKVRNRFVVLKNLGIAPRGKSSLTAPE
mgnify:CR=1 FL=1